MINVLQCKIGCSFHLFIDYFLLAWLLGSVTTVVVEDEAMGVVVAGIVVDTCTLAKTEPSLPDDEADNEAIGIGVL